MEEIWKNSPIIEQVNEIIVVFNEKGEILYGNCTAMEKLDYTEDGLKTCNMSAIFRQDFQREDGTYEEFDLKKLESREETAMYRKNSSCFPVSIRFFRWKTAQNICWQTIFPGKKTWMYGCGT